jgi:hypothetical protein
MINRELSKIDAEEIRRFDEEGAVTIDTPLSHSELRDASAAMDERVCGQQIPAQLCAFEGL